MGIGPAISGPGKTSSLSRNFVGFQEPIRGENVLQLQNGWTREAQHKFFVGDPCYEIGGDQILRAGKGDPAIHDRNLAMVAQVQPRSLAAEETDGQHFLDVDSQRGQFRHQNAQAGAIAQGVHEHSARHTALGCSTQRGNHWSCCSVVRKDVVKQMDVVPGLVDVCR